METESSVWYAPEQDYGVESIEAHVIGHDDRFTPNILLSRALRGLPFLPLFTPVSIRSSHGAASHMQGAWRVIAIDAQYYELARTYTEEITS